jgi:hypothetical protein
MIPFGIYPGSGRVLVIGRSPEVNQGVVERLVELGINARGFTQLDSASELNAREFDLIVFGRGALGPLSERLKREFATQNPDARFIDTIAPVAAEQTLAALAHDPRIPRFVERISVSARVGVVDVEATVLASCQVVFTLFMSNGRLVSKELGQVSADPGALSLRVAAGDLENANSLLLTAEGTEHHLHAFLKS